MFRPRLLCTFGPTLSIARYLDRLLQPIYDQMASTTTFHKGADAVHALELYKQKGLLKPTTHFATLHIDHLHTMFPHKETIQALEHFLHDHGFNGHIQGLTINTIVQLVRLILRNQYFIYDNRLFQQMKGGGPGAPLTALLADIYMLYWQQNLVSILNEKNELFGRYDFFIVLLPIISYTHLFIDVRISLS